MEIVKVEFIVDNVVIGEDTTYPYSFNWVYTSGSHQLIVKTHFSDGSIKLSPTTNINEFAGYETETSSYMNNLSIPNDATIYYNATPQQTTGATLWTTIDEFVKREKAALRWSKIKYFRPGIGTTAAMQSKNLKDIATFDGVYSGGWTFDGSGRKPNGTTGTMATGLTPSLDIASVDDSGMTMVTYGDAAATGYMMSSGTGGNFWLINESASSWFSYYPNLTKITDSTGKIGVKTITRTDSNTRNYRNGVLVGTANVAHTNMPNLELHEGSRGDGTDYYEGYIGSSAVHTGLTDAEAIAFQNSISLLEADLLRKNW